ncbi:MAG: hypothetical protein LBI65_00835 [Candidatus Symbiothrix sp.]|jgi:putative ABC transport system permease protein|nr:hypothetical protein [Candidatus Symbiothrix sp.]
MKYFFGNFFHVLKAFRTSSAINIAGLSAALIVFFVVLMQVHYDFTYDRGYRNADRIAQINMYDKNTGNTLFYVNFQIPALISERIPETGAYCLLDYFSREESFDVDKGGIAPEIHKIPYIRTTSGFLKVFTPEIIAGDTTGIFSTYGMAMISEKTAQQLFGEQDPIGRSIKYHHSNNVLTVKAVYRDFPKNSSMINGLYTYLPEDSNADNHNSRSYFLIQPENRDLVSEKINSAEILGEEDAKYREEHPDEVLHYRFSPLNELYLKGAEKGGKRINTTFTLLVTGILTLLIAFVNFVNLSLAMAPSRVRGMNIRKILGINKTTLRLSVAGESVLFTGLALLIAFTGIHLLKENTLAREMFSVDFSLEAHTGLLVTTSLLILLIAFVIGLYTMRYSTSFDESEALKGSFVTGVKGVKLRNALIVFQFVTAIVLICLSTLIKRQNDYMMNYDWGMSRENIIYFPLVDLGKNSRPFAQELLRDPRVADYCIIRDLPGRITMGWGRQFEGKSVNLQVWSVDDRFFDFFDVNIIAGRKPDQMDSDVSQIIVNETFLRTYDFDETIVGKDFEAFGPGRIQAIAKDVNFQSLHDSITPMAFAVLNQWQNFDRFLVKLTGSDRQGAIHQIEQMWNQFSKEPFSVNYLDEETNRLYQRENNLAKLISLFGLIIVIIAVMGVYGLIIFNARYKAREIAIRKVNGSTVGEIMFLLNRSVLIQLLIAFVIAIPVAGYLMHGWLENFAYRVPVSPWIYLLGGIIILLVTLATVSIRTYRAAMKNPAKTLKSEG